MKDIPSAYYHLQSKLDLLDEIPYTKDWSAAADFLELIVEHCLTHKPTTIFECSSGLTTLMLAKCCALNNKGHVYSLENGEEYAVKTRESISQYQIEQFSDVIYAPLESDHINGKEYQWYALNDVPDKTIDMLVIDGPPGFIQKHSRYPALPKLYERLADGCTIFLDDAARDDERQLVQMWLDEFPALSHEFVDNERGCSVLTLKR